MLRKITRFLLWDLLIVALVSGFAALTFYKLVRPAMINGWLSNSGIYEKITDGLIDQNSVQLSQQSISGVPLDNPDVQQAIKKAFPPTFWQQSTEEVIASIFQWLEGKTEQPDFSIDIQPNKTILATEVAAAARKRAESLPACPPRQLPSGNNPFEISCRPQIPGSIDLIVASYIAKLQASPEFLPSTKININTLITGEQTKVTTLSSENKSIVRLYGYSQLLPFVLLGVSIGLLALLILTSQSRLSSLRGIGIGIMVLAVVCGVLLAATSYSLQTVRSKFTEQRTQNTFIDASRVSIDKLFDAVDHDLTRTGIMIIGGYGAVGGAMIIGSFALTSIQKKKQRKELGIEKEQGDDKKPESIAPNSSVVDAKAKFQEAMKNADKQ